MSPSSASPPPARRRCSRRWRPATCRSTRAPTSRPAQLLGVLSPADLIVHVVRAYGESDVDPGRDVGALDLELALADLGIAERRIERLTVESRSLPAGARRAPERGL